MAAICLPQVFWIQTLLTPAMSILTEVSTHLCLDYRRQRLAILLTPALVSIPVSFLIDCNLQNHTTYYVAPPLGAFAVSVTHDSPVRYSNRIGTSMGS